MNPDETTFDFIRKNNRQGKPRTRGITEIRAAYYTPFGKNYFSDLLNTMGSYIDSIKFAGGSFILYPEKQIREIINLAHTHNVMVSTGGFIEYVLTQEKDVVKKYIHTCKELGFDIIEISSGFISIPVDDVRKIIEEVHKAGLKAKPEIGIQFGAGGNTSEEKLKEEGIQNVQFAIQKAKKFLDAGAYVIMIESEGVTENVESWRMDVPAEFINEIGLEKLMFESADPNVFEWYIKNYGSEVNLFVDHSQIVQLECYRAGIWGTNTIWGRILTY
jgi:phosphosulfolactate synthase (CoM biosynthesis protein A)